MRRVVEQLERRLLLAFNSDLTFGEGGLAKAGVGAGGSALAVEEIAGGKYLAGGEGGNNEPAVARFNHDGTLDTSFNGTGKMDLTQYRDAVVRSAAFGPDGKLFLVYDDFVKDSLVVLRFNVDGTPDTSFGSGGSVTYAVASQTTGNEKIAVQADGKILIGYPADAYSGNTKVYLVRLNADGTNDVSFRGGVDHAVPLPVLINIRTVALSPDGKIDILGDSASGVEILRLNPDGSTDMSFGGGDGLAEPPTQTASTPTGNGRLTVAPNGKLLVLYQQNKQSQDALFLARLTSSGATDATFGGGDGFLEIGIALSSGEVSTPCVAIRPDGRIVGVHYVYPMMQFFQVTPRGMMDDTFGTNGIAVAQSGVVAASTISIDAEGNVLVGGMGAVYPNLEDFEISRFADSAPVVSMNSAGHIYIQGSDDADVITVERQGDQVVVHRNGVDTAYSGASVKTLNVYPSAGGDVITETAGIPATIFGGSGNDTITVGAGDVFIDGGAGNDRITCGKGNHDVFLGAGNNRVTTGRGRDTILGDLFGSGGNDTITTGAQSDYISSQGGNDLIRCGSGWDSIYTGDGNDTVYGGPGNDKIQDTIEPSEGSDGDPPGLSTGHKHYYGGDGNDSITGSSEADTIFGNGGADTIQGKLGADSISGGGGNDEIWGNDPYDNSYNGQDFSANTIHGGEGNDHILGPAERTGCMGMRGIIGFMVWIRRTRSRAALGAIRCMRIGRISWAAWRCGDDALQS